MIKYGYIYRKIEARPVKSTAQNGLPTEDPIHGTIRAARKRDGRRSGFPRQGGPLADREKIPPAVAAVRSAIDVPEHLPNRGQSLPRIPEHAENGWPRPRSSFFER